MGSKSSAPPPVNYTDAAKEQGVANIEAARQQSLMNNPNMVTPYGNQTYTMGADGRPIMTQTLSPAEQAKLDASNRVQSGSLDLLEKDMPYISDALLKPFGYGGIGAQGIGDGTTTQARTDLGDTGNIQKSLDFSGAPGMPQSDYATQMRTMMAQYAKGAQFLDPQYENAENKLRSDLVNQGISRNSEAYNKDYDTFDRSKRGAYSDLTQNSILSGNQELNAQYARDMASRQQGVNEITTKGQFANSAQAQQLQDMMAKFNAFNTGANQNNTLQQMIAQMHNAARAQNYAEYTNDRTMPINMLSALLSGSQVNNPQFQPTAPTSLAPPPILQGAQLQGQQNAATSSANSAGQGQTMGLIGGLASAAAIAF